MVEESKVTPILKTYSVAAGTVLLAGPLEMEVAGGWVVPSEEPAVPKPACLEGSLVIQSPQWEAGTAELRLAPGVKHPPKGVCSKRTALEEAAHIQTYLPRRYSERSLHRRRGSPHTQESAP